MTKYNHEWFLDRLKTTRPELFKEFKFLSPYKSSRTKMKALHLPCNSVIEVVPNSMISRGSSCRTCSRRKVTTSQTKTHSEFLEEVPDSVTVLTEYQGAYTLLDVKCSLCDKEYSVVARELAQGGCSRCKGMYNRSIHDIKEETYDETNGEYNVTSGTYINAHTKVSMRHNTCGNTYEVTMANFRNKGRRCPHCLASRGEQTVHQILEEEGFEFETQKRFPNLIHERQLSYDFYIPSLRTLIEYHGEQHYKPVEFFGGEEKLVLQKRLDGIKREYATTNRMRLIEIPYTAIGKKKVREMLIKQLNLPVTH